MMPVSIKRAALSLFFSVLLFPTPFATAQGCSACRDDTAGSAPQVRQSLRKAIPILGVPAAILFLGVLLLAAKARPGNPAAEKDKPDSLL